MGKGTRKSKRGRKSEKPVTLPRYDPRPMVVEERGPTPELEAKKAALSGGVCEDPIAHLPPQFCNGLRQALDLYRRQRHLAGFGAGRMVAALDDVSKGTPDLPEEMEIERRAKYETASANVYQFDIPAYRALDSFTAYWGGPWSGSLGRLYLAAGLLADGYSIILDEAA